MTWNRGAQRATIVVFFTLLAVVYAVVWLQPAIGLDHDEAAYLVTAGAMATGHGYTIESLPTPVPQTNFPPLFPAVLALLMLISRQTQWLKLLPLVCTAGWLILTRRLLLKMGASGNGTMLLVALTAASPTVIFLSTNLLPESLFALLATAALLALLAERAMLTGVFVGLATLTLTAGVALIAACILTLVVRRRFSGALVLAAVAMAIAAPWFGWSIAHVTHDGSYAGYTASNILTGLAANEKLVVAGRNLLLLLASPFSLLTGLSNVYSIVGTLAVLIWCFFVRRQLVPDLFVVLYGLTLLCRISPPERLVAAVLPLVLWIVWRVFRLIPSREAAAALVLIVAVLTIWADATRLFHARSGGYFSTEGAPADNWNEMQILFGFISTNTTPDSVLLANLDGEIFRNTGRKAVRGSAPDNFDLYYATRQSGATPDQLSNAITREQIGYVVLTPDLGMAESASFHKSVEALERGGIIEPVDIPGASRDYRIFKVIAH